MNPVLTFTLYLIFILIISIFYIRVSQLDRDSSLQEAFITGSACRLDSSDFTVIFAAQTVLVSLILGL
jgi:hypothetical protein